MGGGGVAAFGWRFVVGLHLSGDAGEFITVALSGLFSDLEYDGCQMLGLNSRSYVVPNTNV
jgi:hypothetical protein